MRGMRGDAGGERTGELGAERCGVRATADHHGVEHLLVSPSAAGASARSGRAGGRVRLPAHAPLLALRRHVLHFGLVPAQCTKSRLNAIVRLSFVSVVVCFYNKLGDL